MVLSVTDYVGNESTYGTKWTDLGRRHCSGSILFQLCFFVVSRSRIPLT